MNRPTNMKEKYLVIGDIHGCVGPLKKLIKKIGGDELSKRILIFIGDYIDRGPDSMGVVEFLLKLSEKYNCVFLRGNHEQMLLDALQKGKEQLWFINGGQQTLSSYGVNHVTEIPSCHRDFYFATKLYYDSANYFFVHAGISPMKKVSQSITDNDPDEFLWTRSHLDAECYKWEKTVVFGHTPVSEVIMKKNQIGLDTGCVYSESGLGKLTAIKLPEKEIIQQSCSE